MPRPGCERIGTSDGSGAFVWITTVRGSGATTASTPSNRNEVLACSVRIRSKLHFTSADVRALPLRNLMPGRSVNVVERPSGLTFQAVATFGRGVRRSSPWNVTSVS